MSLQEFKRNYDVSFEYFERQNEENIYIETRDGEFNQYAVWQNNCIVDDCLGRMRAFRLAQDLLSNEV